MIYHQFNRTAVLGIWELTAFTYLFMVHIQQCKYSLSRCAIFNFTCIDCFYTQLRVIVVASCGYNLEAILSVPLPW